MASTSKKSSAKPADRPPAEQIARELYKQQFGTTKPDAELPHADANFDPDAPMGAAVDENKESSDS